VAGGGLPNIDDFPRRLTDLLVLDLLNQRRPGLHDTLHLLGLIENEPAPAAGQSSRRLNWERFSQLIEHPGQIVNDVYGWDTDFDTTKFLTRLETLMRTEVMAGGVYPQSSTIQGVLGNSNAGLPELRYPLFQKGVTPETFASVWRHVHTRRGARRPEEGPCAPALSQGSQLIRIRCV